METNSFLKTIGLGALDLQLVTPLFDDSELPEHYLNPGYLNETERELFLAASHCVSTSEHIKETMKKAGNNADAKQVQIWYNQAEQMNLRKDLCLQLMALTARKRLDINYQLSMAIRHDYLVASFPPDSKELTEACEDCPYADTIEVEASFN